VRELLRDGVDVDLDTLREALGRLSRSERKPHREAAARQLRRLDSLFSPDQRRRSANSRASA